MVSILFIGFKYFFPSFQNDILVLGDHLFDSLQIVRFDLMGIFTDEVRPVPSVLCIAAISADMNVNGFVFVGEEQEDEPVVSKQFRHGSLPLHEQR